MHARPQRHRSLLASALILCALLASGAGPAQAAQRRAEPATPGPQPLAPGAPAFSDRILGRRGAKRRRNLGARAATATYTTPDGYRVKVSFSKQYVEDPAVAQSFVDFLASNLHGFELGLVSLFIAPPPEIASICGGGDQSVLACYDPGPEILYVPGEDNDSGVPKEASITHEYGHHIANNRNDAPYSAFDYGAKHWSSYELVCSRVRRDILAPGNQGARYADDPGESFAEAYAFSQGFVSDWQYNSLLEPNDGSFAAIRTDVLRPWTRNVVRRFRGRLGARKRSRTFRIPIGLDGRVKMKLAGPRRANFNLRLRKSARTVKRTRRRGSRDSLSYRWCGSGGRQTIVAKVVRKRGSGRFRLRVSYPG